jgi:hypothetical protein
MAASVIAGSRRRRGWGWLLALATGGVALTGSYLLVLPVFGVLSAVTWSVIVLCWLWVIGVAIVAAARLGRGGARWWAAGWGVLAVIAAVAIWTIGWPQVTPEWTIGWPQVTPEGYFRHHRDDLARLAAEYRAGWLGGDTGLRWRQLSMSIDSRSHRRCGLSDPRTGRKECALFLLAWQNWRAEVGAGFAYYPTRPGPDASIVTAAGDTGSSARELGDGWWWVD